MGVAMWIKEREKERERECVCVCVCSYLSRCVWSARCLVLTNRQLVELLYVCTHTHTHTDTHTHSQIYVCVCVCVCVCDVLTNHIAPSTDGRS